MYRFASGFLGLTLGILPILTSVPTAFSQGVSPDTARIVPEVERVGNVDFHPTRRQLRKRARGRQAKEASTFMEYRLQYRTLQQQRTLENLRSGQRRLRLQKKLRLQGYMEQKGEWMMNVHERMAPRRAPGTRQGKSREYFPSSKRSRPGETRLRPERDPCRNIIGTRRSRCYYRLQSTTIPSS